MANRVKNGTKFTKNAHRGILRGCKGSFGSRILVAMSDPKADGTPHRLTITRRQATVQAIFDAVEKVPAREAVANA